MSSFVASGASHIRSLVAEVRSAGFPQGKVYRVDLSADYRDVSTLDAEERQRAARFRDARSQSSFIAMRAALRAVLAGALDCDEREIEFGYRHYGKPYLRRPAVAVHFNISHTDELGLIALSPGSDLGVDVERIRREEELFEIANRFFSRAESEQLRAVPEGLQLQAFFRIWTRKEAVLKLIGSGLSAPLDSFSVSLDESARILGATLPELSHPCRLLDLGLGPDFAGCLAWRDNDLGACPADRAGG